MNSIEHFRDQLNNGQNSPLMRESLKFVINRLEENPNDYEWANDYIAFQEKLERSYEPSKVVKKNMKVSLFKRILS